MIVKRNPITNDAALIKKINFRSFANPAAAIPAMIAYTYEANVDKKRAATVISFHALGWLAGIAAAGFAK